MQPEEVDITRIPCFYRITWKTWANYTFSYFILCFYIYHLYIGSAHSALINEYIGVFCFIILNLYIFDGLLTTKMVCLRQLEAPPQFTYLYYFVISNTVVPQESQMKALFSTSFVYSVFMQILAAAFPDKKFRRLELFESPEDVKSEEMKTKIRRFFSLFAHFLLISIQIGLIAHQWPVLTSKNSLPFKLPENFEFQLPAVIIGLLLVTYHRVFSKFWRNFYEKFWKKSSFMNEIPELY